MSNRLTEIAIAKEIGIPAHHACVVGSTLICGSGNDVDILCLVPDEGMLSRIGFVPDIEAQYESVLHSYRRDGQNIIATNSPSFFYAEVAIAHAARAISAGHFDMKEREERIRFHGEVRAEVLARLADDVIGVK